MSDQKTLYVGYSPELHNLMTELMGKWISDYDLKCLGLIGSPTMPEQDGEREHIAKDFIEERIGMIEESDFAFLNITEPFMPLMLDLVWSSKIDKPAYCLVPPYLQDDSMVVLFAKEVFVHMEHWEGYLRGLCGYDNHKDIESKEG